MRVFLLRYDEALFSQDYNSREPLSFFKYIRKWLAELWEMVKNTIRMEVNHG